jgi:branched-subunit amino acid ABC-type transport system permease component
MRIVNFAHPVAYTLGAYFLVTLLPVIDQNFFIVALISVLAVIPVGYIIERFVIRKLYGVSIDYAIIATYAVFLIGIDIIKWVWGTTPIPLSDPLNKEFVLFGVPLPLYRVIVILISIGIYLFLLVFFKKTIIGKIVVAALEDKEAVSSLGINVNKYFSIVFVLGSLLAGVGGVLYAPITSVHPYMGFMILLISFAVVIVGGLGNIQGTFVSAFSLGMVMAMTGRYWPSASEAMVFMVMAVVLIFKPIEV